MWQSVVELLQTQLVPALAPGAAVCIRTSTDILLSTAVGRAEIQPRERVATLGTPWDLASLTKVLCTAPLCMALVEEGRLDLDRPLDEWLLGAPAGVTARHCLQHTSGLANWRPLFQRVLDEGLTWGTASTRASVLRWARTTPVVASPGATHVYSDLGMMLLCAAVEELEGERVDALWERRVRCRAEVDLRWGWPEAAATEDCPVRGRVVVGEVHDLNAAVMGGVSTHAGLFGTAEGVAAMAAWQLRAWRGGEGGLRPSTVARFWSERGVGSHRLGWDGVTPGSSSAGPRWPLDGVGHTGFTGTSIWVAPRQDLIVALLTNRVHPTVDGGSVPDAPVSERTRLFREFRPRFHTAVLDALGIEA